jgi:hypothetical protein
MGTRSLTYFYQNGKPFTAFYRQFDGYPDGHGAEIGKILANIRLVNGYGSGDVAGEVANGPGCLAAQIVAELKNESGLGGIYLINPNPEENKDGWQEYEYHIHVNSTGEGFTSEWGESFVECWSVGRVSTLIFSGPFKDFYKWAQKPKTDKDGEYVPVIILPNKGKVNIAKHAKPELRDALHSGEVEVTFNKADGTKRVMRCTVNAAMIPEDKIPAGTSKVADSRHDHHLFKVFDLDKQDWRSFREERVINYEVL